MHIDLNCDLGEGSGHDADLMPLITSANIACGGHAGDESTMRATVALAQQHGVTMGAHPGYADRAGFGRREMNSSADELRLLLRSQIAALALLAKLRHVKPHGGLYNLAARDKAVATTVAAAVKAIDSSLILFALAGSELARAGRAAGLRVAEEAFADRTYQRDGSLTPRYRPDALIVDEAVAAAQVLHMVRDGFVRTTEGVQIPIHADTVCVHGDGPNAVGFARRLRTELINAGVEVKAF